MCVCQLHLFLFLAGMYLEVVIDAASVGIGRSPRRNAKCLCQHSKSVQEAPPILLSMKED